MNTIHSADYPSLSASSARNDVLTKALEEYRALLEAGQRPDRDAFLAAHAEAGPELSECLAGLEFIFGAAPSLTSASGSLGALAQAGAEVPGTLGDFRIVREVGRGGMGIVYEALQISLNRRVALKVLPFAATMDPRHLQRFKNEAQAAACLDHPHIVKVHAVGSERAVHFFAMQFIDGQTVEALIRSLRAPGGEEEAAIAGPTGNPPGEPASSSPGHKTEATVTREPGATRRSHLGQEHFRRVAEWGIQAAEALEHAHSLGIVHRDIKPANLLIDGSGKLWITDFGLARTATDTGLTMTGDLVGTLRYMSPEQALAKHGLVDHRTDIYALGATLYELLTLQAAVCGADREEILQQIATGEPRPPRSLNPIVPADLETIVLKTLAKQPSERYASAGELADDLRRYLEHKLVRAKRPGIRQVLAKWARRNRILVAAGCICLFTLTTVFGGAAGWIAHDHKVRRDKTAKLAHLLARYMLIDSRGTAAEKMDALEQAFASMATASVNSKSLVGTWHHRHYRDGRQVGDFEIELREGGVLVMLRAQKCDKDEKPTSHTPLNLPGRWFLFDDVLVFNWVGLEPNLWVDILVVDKIGDQWVYQGANPTGGLNDILRGSKRQVTPAPKLRRQPAF